MNLLLGISGSVAVTVAPRLINELQSKFPNISLKVVATEAAKNFLYPEAKIYHRDYAPILDDRSEWSTYATDRKVLHIELRNWADMLLIAPLSANTLAKMANGLSDNLLTCVVRAWDRNKPVIVAPAMNTHMWEHPATKEHWNKLATWYPKFHLIHPVEKLLACGDHGMGAMAPTSDILKVVEDVHTHRSN